MSFEKGYGMSEYIDEKINISSSINYKNLWLVKYEDDWTKKKKIVRFPPPCIKFASATFETIFTHLINALVGFYWCMKNLTKLSKKRTFRIDHFSKVGI